MSIQNEKEIVKYLLCVDYRNDDESLFEKGSKQILQ